MDESSPPHRFMFLVWTVDTVEAVDRSTTTQGGIKKCIP